ncbi:hypothetical protein L6164_022695 [Bauhinia variegata]|uniref:Uncharacterized protein n=1 Tax=Bauhinia variegata TaxID=167791 RepID=A0ACB9MHU2_BAUVA|nr:hypothetical protein L6164_022695 [Bauhinia variegata]
MTFPRALLLSLLALCFVASSYGLLLPDEVQALKDIAKTLGKTDWDFNVDPCSGESNWVKPLPLNGEENAVTCGNCSLVNGTNFCHVVSIVLKQENLNGTLPSDLGRFPYLYEIDLTRNYLNGTIPKEWGSIKLINISLLGNRLTGPIPKELGNITTLKSLVLEYNQFSGNIPPELGNLIQIERLFLTSNNFTGDVPATFERLTALKDVRIGDNHLSGTIPNFIQNWTRLEKLVIQGSGLSGPIPSGISFLTNLIDLRITDLQNGTDSTFPQLANSTSLQTLILRSCNINGTLPEYLGNMRSLITIDLSFNKLSGTIPSSYYGLRKSQYLYLTGNLLTGPVPDWTDQAGAVDLSYNNFSVSNSGQQTCQTGSVNLFSSSSMDNDLGIPCLGSASCPKYWYSLLINCGGKQVSVNGNTYDDDSDAGGPARFWESATNWAESNTGHFMDNTRSPYYTWSNSSGLSMTNAELYTDARVSPISLTYYGFCLGNGSYTVNLHFAEIMFTDDTTYGSLGRRVFDVYIQGKLVLKDFNIAREAGGVDKAIIKNFTAIVTRSTLEIRFYWAGKGTIDLPFRSVYGPLISAISVVPDFTPPLTPSEDGSSLATGAVVAIVAAGAIVIILMSVILWWRCCRRKRNSLASELKSLDLRTGIFTLRQMKAATNNFDDSNKIGEGGFGPVYKGFLPDGTVIAVKQLSSKSKQGNREFINEIGLISALQHPHLVKLYGCCVEGDQLLLVYEYMENNSLAHALFGPEESRLKLDWPTRYKICISIAKGLVYLHEESRLKIVHRDIKATNVLLDKDLTPKISDFGLAKLDEEDDTHINTRIAGTFGYMAPEYAMHGYLTYKADIYSFGVLALEIVSGMRNTTSRPTEECFYLLDWAKELKEEDDLLKLIDERLDSDFNEEEAIVMINVALLCTNPSQKLRPTMSSVVRMLESRTVVQELVSDQSETLDEKKSESMRLFNHQTEESQCLSMDQSWTDVSTSVTDLNPRHLDSSYWGKQN